MSLLDWIVRWRKVRTRDETQPLREAAEESREEVIHARNESRIEAVKLRRLTKRESRQADRFIETAEEALQFMREARSRQ